MVTKLEQEEKPNLRKKLKEISLEWIKSSTSHGLPNIFRTDQIYLKIIWAILFLTGVSSFCYTFQNYVRTYVSYPVKVNTEIVNEAPAKFPAITICNLNPFSFNKSRNELTRASEFFNISKSIDTTSSTISQYQKLNSILKFYVAADTNLTETDRKMLGFDLEDMLISCSFNGNPCNSSDFYWFRDYDYGNCYTFNSGKSGSAIRYTSSSGAGYSLELEMYVGDPMNDDLLAISRGLYVVVQNQSLTPLMKDEGIKVAAGVETNLAIRRTFISKLSNPYRDCLKDVNSNSSFDSLYYTIIFNHLNQNQYRRKYCYQLCLQSRILDDCKCFHPKFPRFFNNTCSSVSEYTCAAETEIDFLNEDVAESCKKQCPSECDSIQYNIRSSYASYPSTKYSNTLASENRFRNLVKNLTEFSENILKLNIYYETMDYIVISDSIGMTEFDLISSIGGVLGLFIGISLLSVFEVLEIACEMIRLSYLHLKNRKTLKPFKNWAEKK